MANGIEAAFDEASRLEEIGFTEFTVKLVLEVFEGLNVAAANQQQAFVELLQATSKTLSDYLTEGGANDIPPEEILGFITQVIGTRDDGSPKALTGLSEGEISTLNEAVQVAGETNAITTPSEDAILTAVAQRIAATKYQALQEMVRLGVCRLKIYDGKIETGMTLNTYANRYLSTNSSSFERRDSSFSLSGRTGSFFDRYVRLSGGYNSSRIAVRTTNASQQDTSGSSVNIFGRVTICFRSDFVPLAQAT